MLEYQALLMDKMKQVESLCLGELNEIVEEDGASDLQLILGQIGCDLKRSDISEVKLDRIKGLLSDELMQVEKVLFQNKCMLVVKAKEDEAVNGNKDGQCNGISSN